MIVFGSTGRIAQMNISKILARKMNNLTVNNNNKSVQMIIVRHLVTRMKTNVNIIESQRNVIKII